MKQNRRQRRWQDLTAEHPRTEAETAANIVASLIINKTMDVLISAAQGKGKTTMARAVAMTYLGTTSWTEASAYVVEFEEFHDLKKIRYALDKYRPRIVIFDNGALTAPEHLHDAIAAVKAYREDNDPSAIERELLAIYVEQHSATQPVIILQSEDKTKNF